MAVNVPPVQVVEAFDGVAIFSCEGIVSVKARLVADAVLMLLSIVKVSLLVPPSRIGLGEKLLLNPGAAFTVRVSLGVPLVPSDEVRAPEVFRCAPASLLVTSTVTVQLEVAGTVPPE